MEYYNQTFNHSSSPNQEVPLVVTYLNMVVILMVTIVVITPAVMVINVISWTKELHTKYYFFVVNLLATNIGSITVRSILQYLIMIMYLIGKNSKATGVALKWSVLFVVTNFHLMTVMLPITLAVERMIVISFPYHHRSIMTTKRAIGILATMWGLSAILAIIITIVVPVDIVWPLALVDWDVIYLPFIYTIRLTSAIFIVAANLFLLYKVTISNRKAKENQRLGNEEQAKRSNKLLQLFRSQSKATTTLLLMGGIDVIANMMIPFLHVIVSVFVEPSKKVYVEQFFLYPLKSFLLLIHPLVYGLYMKKIRKRLPDCPDCPVKRKSTRSRVVSLRKNNKK